MFRKMHSHLIFVAYFPITRTVLFCNFERKEKKTHCIFETVYGFLKLRLMRVIYILEPYMYYQWKALAMTIPTI